MRIDDTPRPFRFDHISQHSKVRPVKNNDDDAQNYQKQFFISSSAKT